jgi:hypothetical protein
VFFKFKLYLGNNYCSKCYSIVQAKDIEEENKKFEQTAQKRKRLQLEKAKLRNKIADKKLLEDLERERIKRLKKIQKKAEKLWLKQQKKSKEKNTTVEFKSEKQTRLYFDKDTIQQYDTLLYIEVDVNQLTAVEWLHGKKRVVLNNKRELRRTKAGGFSAEKFQKFIDTKRKETVDWAIELLNRPGVLRNRYDLIQVVSTKVNLKEELEFYLKKYQR